MRLEERQYNIEVIVHFRKVNTFFQGMTASYDISATVKRHVLMERKKCEMNEELDVYLQGKPTF